VCPRHGGFTAVCPRHGGLTAVCPRHGGLTVVWNAVWRGGERPPTVINSSGETYLLAIASLGMNSTVSARMPAVLTSVRVTRVTGAMLAAHPRARTSAWWLYRGQTAVKPPCRGALPRASRPRVRRGAGLAGELVGDECGEFEVGQPGLLTHRAQIQAATGGQMRIVGNFHHRP
jgi:hypothetical protein